MAIKAVPGSLPMTRSCFSYFWMAAVRIEILAVADEIDLKMSAIVFFSSPEAEAAAGGAFDCALAGELLLPPSDDVEAARPSCWPTTRAMRSAADLTATSTWSLSRSRCRRAFMSSAVRVDSLSSPSRSDDVISTAFDERGGKKKRKGSYRGS